MDFRNSVMVVGASELFSVQAENGVLPIYFPPLYETACVGGEMIKRRCCHVHVIRAMRNLERKLSWPISPKMLV